MQVQVPMARGQNVPPTPGRTSWEVGRKEVAVSSRVRGPTPPPTATDSPALTESASTPTPAARAARRSHAQCGGSSGAARGGGGGGGGAGGVASGAGAGGGGGGGGGGRGGGGGGTEAFWAAAWGSMVSARMRAVAEATAAHVGPSRTRRPVAPDCCVESTTRHESLCTVTSARARTGRAEMLPASRRVTSAATSASVGHPGGTIDVSDSGESPARALVAHTHAASAAAQIELFTRRDCRLGQAQGQRRECERRGDQQLIRFAVDSGLLRRRARKGRHRPA